MKTYLKFLSLPVFALFFSACTNNLNNENIPLPPKIEVVETKPVEEKIEPPKVEDKPEILRREGVSINLTNSIRAIISDLSKQDLNLINQKYIHPKFGFYNLYKVDDIKTFNHQKMVYNIVESDYYEVSQILKDLPKNIKNLALVEQDIKFDCSPENDEFYGWNGEGVYFSDNTQNYLSKMMKNANELQPNKYTQDDLNKADFIERTAYKVVVTPELVFYINKIDKRWYITLFDRITTDCTEEKKGR